MEQNSVNIVKEIGGVKYVFMAPRVRVKRNVLDVIDKIQNFSGEDSYPIHEYLESVNDFAHLCGWSETDIVFAFKFSICGEAKLFLKNEKLFEEGVEVIKEALRERYTAKQSLALRVRQLTTAKQKQGESVKEFFSRIEALSKVGRIYEGLEEYRLRVLFDVAKEGLDKKYLPIIFSGECATYEKLKKSVVSAEETFNLRNIRTLKQELWSVVQINQPECDIRTEKLEVVKKELEVKRVETLEKEIEKEEICQSAGVGKENKLLENIVKVIEGAVACQSVVGEDEELEKVKRVEIRELELVREEGCLPIVSENEKIEIKVGDEVRIEFAEASFGETLYTKLKMSTENISQNVTVRKEKFEESVYLPTRSVGLHGTSSTQENMVKVENFCEKLDLSELQEEMSEVVEFKVKKFNYVICKRKSYVSCDCQVGSERQSLAKDEYFHRAAQISETEQVRKEIVPGKPPPLLDKCVQTDTLMQDLNLHESNLMCQIKGMVLVKKTKINGYKKNSETSHTTSYKLVRNVVFLLSNRNWVKIRLNRKIEGNYSVSTKKKRCGKRIRRKKRKNKIF